MAKIRTIKPEFWDNERLASLPYGCRLLFIGIWNFTDDAGVIKASEKYIKSKVFPYDDNLRLSEITKWLDSLAKYRLIIPISYSSESYYLVRSFAEHQRIDERYAKFTIPKEVSDKALLEATLQTTTCSHGVHNVTTSLIGGGKDRIGSVEGKEGNIDTVISVCGAGSITPPSGSKKDKQEVCHPTPEEVASYFKEKGYREDVGYKAHEYYATNDWKDSKDKPVKNWKQKMIAVWFKPENVETKQQSYTPTDKDQY